MAVYCPRTGRRVVYLQCMDCDTRECRGEEREYCSSENKDIQLKYNQKGDTDTCSTTKNEKKKD